ncbi:metallophosphoesterase family protein [Naasia lichenicola]|uniref:Phosphoesterase n=1 Tax=Naasia lichenicola TaxID=2565933 RepID=A0A4V3WSL7_9MICO|nr:metallophosphoesterase [Naasia lichenicola]THG28597.1 metallophosphoesterase [Naasia lichenicola]
MTRLLVVADTHVPLRAKRLPNEVLELLPAVDVVVHAGDWVDEPTLDLFEESSRVLVACWGNNDGSGLRSRLPETARVEVDGIRIAVTHETGPKEGRERRADERFPDVDLLIFGHSHIPWDSVAPSGMRLLNPGSPTDRRAQPHASYLVVDIAAGRIDADLRLIPRRQA